jgi:hypothetical protein
MALKTLKNKLFSASQAMAGVMASRAWKFFR